MFSSSSSRHPIHPSYQCNYIKSFHTFPHPNLHNGLKKDQKVKQKCHHVFRNVCRAWIYQINLRPSAYKYINQAHICLMVIFQKETFALRGKSYYAFGVLNGHQTSADFDLSVAQRTWDPCEHLKMSQCVYQLHSWLTCTIKHGCSFLQILKYLRAV